MSEGVIIAIISAAGVVLAALIKGIFSIAKSKDNSQSSTKHNQYNKTNIKQKQGFASRGTQIGVQNNYNNNTTVKFGDTTIDNGTIIIDGGTASGGGSIRYEPSENKDSTGVNKNE